ncbi:MAG: hypothetical protein EA349_07650 [Halomonadaceae bacterium]|nr:MAG: hypothetical protein EA349_07650 [Halomonadaceae bacterium]
MKKLNMLVLAAVVGATAPGLASAGNHAIHEDAVKNAQSGWCDALLDISKTNEEHGHSAAKKLAGEVIDAAYGYQMGEVLFKPTMTVQPQTFRTTREGALSYFVGGDSNYPDDSGFALNGWTNCEVENAAIFISDRTANTMGKVHFTDGDGDVTTVDKTWTFYNDDEGDLRIVLHHSSLEYTGN